MQNNPSSQSPDDAARVFFALWPQARARAELQQLALRQQQRLGGRMVCAEALHLTLLFLGRVPRVRLPALLTAAGEVQRSPAHFALDRCVCWRAPGIACAVPAQPPPALMRLAAALARAVTVAGLNFDRRAFSPHVTLLRGIAAFPAAQPVAPILWQAEEFCLVESLRVPQGPRYEILHRWRL